MKVKLLVAAGLVLCASAYAQNSSITPASAPQGTVVKTNSTSQPASQAGAHAASKSSAHSVQILTDARPHGDCSLHGVTITGNANIRCTH